MKRYFRILLSLLFIVLLQSCATTAKKSTSVHGDKPLIDTAKIIVEGLSPWTDFGFFPEVAQDCNNTINDNDKIILRYFFILSFTRFNYIVHINFK